MSFELQKPYPLIEIIQKLFDGFQKDSSEITYDEENLFVNAEDDEKCYPQMIVYLDNSVSDDEYDEENNPEGYSQFVLDNELELFCYGYIFSDVMSLYCEQKKDLDVNLFLKCLTHYLEHDDFLDVE